MVKMAVHLINCTKEECSVVCFLWAEGEPGTQLHLRMCAQCGDEVFSRRVVSDWSSLFRTDHTRVTDAEHSRHPTTAMITRNEDGTLELIEKIYI